MRPDGRAIDELRQVRITPDFLDQAHGSALVEFEYGIEEPYTNTPPEEDTDPHEYPRRDEAGQDQINHFFQTGTVIQTCEGVCGSGG